MKTREAQKTELIFKYLREAFESGTKCSPTDANNSEFELPRLYHDVTPRLISEIAELEQQKQNKEPISEVIASFRDFVLAEAKKGNVIIYTFDGPARMKLSDIIDQPADGLLYDLNRDQGTVLTFIDNEDRKWINDYACGLVIGELKRRLEQNNPALREELIAFSKFKEQCSPYAAIVNHEAYVDQYLRKTAEKK